MRAPIAAALATMALAGCRATPTSTSTASVDAASPAAPPDVTSPIPSEAVREQADAAPTSDAHAVEASPVADAGVSWKRCAADRTFRCAPVTQGIARRAPDPLHPAASPDAVCGCAPKRCNAGEFVMANRGTGTWPDGTSRGAFACSSVGVP